MSDNIIKYERIVFKIIQEYLNNNRFLTIDDIIPYINARLKKFQINLNYNGIREIVKSLIKKRLILEKSKLVKDEILNNINRKEIFEYIKQNPGVYFYQIAKKLEKSNYILAWHIKILINFKFIKSEIIENHEVFFEINVPTEKYELYYILSKEKTRKIISFLKLNPEGASKTEICRNLKIHTITFSKYIKSLEKFKIVLKEKLSKKMIFILNESVYNDK